MLRARTTLLLLLEASGCWLWLLAPAASSAAPRRRRRRRRGGHGVALCEASVLRSNPVPVPGKNSLFMTLRANIHFS
jgi:hypothetical protein